MRRVNLTGSLGLIKDPPVKTALAELENASAENDLLDIANAFSMNGAYTPTRILNVTSPTAANIAAVLATLIDDFRRGGQNRTT